MGGVHPINADSEPLAVASKKNYGTSGPLDSKIAKDHGCLDRYFKISERGSSLRTEIMAGAVNFVANAYLLVLMPRILQQGGIDQRVAITAFVLSTAVGSCLVGLTANLPVPVGPGLGCAAFFAYGLTGSHETTDVAVTQMAITVCMLSGCVMSLLSVVDLPRRVFGIVPKSVKDAMPIGLGLLLSLCGFQQMGLVVSDPYTGVRMASGLSISICLGATGAILMAYLAHKGWEFTKFVLPMGIFTLISWFFHASPWPTGLVAIPLLGPIYVNFSALGKFFWSPVGGLILICMFDIGGIVQSVCGFADNVDKRSKKKTKKPLTGPEGVNGEYWVFLSCGIASVLSALLGGTPVIAFGESFAGVEVGGRTGLTSVTTAFCFFLSLPFEPIFRAVPLYASAPVLVLLGVILLKLTKGLKLGRMFTAFPSFCTIALMPFLYSIDKAIWAGLISWFFMTLLDLLSRRLGAADTGEDNVSKADLLRQVDDIMINLKKMKRNLTIADSTMKEIPLAPEIGDLLMSAGNIVLLAEEQLAGQCEDDDGSIRSLKRSTSIQFILTPKIKVKAVEEDKTDLSPLYPSLEQGGIHRG